MSTVLEQGWCWGSRSLKEQWPVWPSSAQETNDAVDQGQRKRPGELRGRKGGWSPRRQICDLRWDEFRVDAICPTSFPSFPINHLRTHRRAHVVSGCWARTVRVDARPECACDCACTCKCKKAKCMVMISTQPSRVCVLHPIFLSRGLACYPTHENILLPQYLHATCTPYLRHPLNKLQGKCRVPAPATHTRGVSGEFHRRRNTTLQHAARTSPLLGKSLVRQELGVGPLHSLGSRVTQSVTSRTPEYQVPDSSQIGLC